jgi:hypothetical protein
MSNAAPCGRVVYLSMTHFFADYWRMASHHADRRVAAEAELPKHKRLLRSAKDGGRLSALMLPLLLLSPPKGYGILTTTGRRTGKHRRKCIRVAQHENRAYLVQLVPPHLAVTRPGAVSGWLWNIRSDPRVRLRIKGGTYTGLAREIVDAGELHAARSILCDTVFSGDFGEASLHLRGLPTQRKIRELHQYWFDTGYPIAIDLAVS